MPTWVIIALFALPVFTSLWGASLFVRAVAMRMEAARARWWARCRHGALAAGAPQASPGHNAGVPDAAAKRKSFVLVAQSRRDTFIGLMIGPLVVLASVAGTAWAVDLGELIEDVFGVADISGWQLATGALVLVAVACAIVGLWFDPPHGRRRCGRCWYDFAGLADTGTCPECGRAARGLGDLRRTRRSRGVLGVAAVLLFASWGTWKVPQVQERGWLMLVPTPVLVAGAMWWPDWAIDGNWPREDSLEDRKAGLWDWEKRWLWAQGTRAMEGRGPLQSVRRGIRLRYIAGDIAQKAGLQGTRSKGVHPKILQAILAATKDPYLGGRRTVEIQVIQNAIENKHPSTRAWVQEHREQLLAALEAPSGHYAAMLLAAFIDPEEQLFASLLEKLMDPARLENCTDAYFLVVRRFIDARPSLIRRVSWFEASEDSIVRRRVVLLHGMVFGSAWNKVQRLDPATSEQARDQLHLMLENSRALLLHAVRTEQDDRTAMSALQWLTEDTSDEFMTEYGDLFEHFAATRKTHRADLLETLWRRDPLLPRLAPFILAEQQSVDPQAKAKAVQLAQQMRSKPDVIRAMRALLADAQRLGSLPQVQQDEVRAWVQSLGPAPWHEDVPVK